MHLLQCRKSYGQNYQYPEMFLEWALFNVSLYWWRPRGNKIEEFNVVYVLKI